MVVDEFNSNENINVLLIEDNPSDARIIQELLKEIKADQFLLTHVNRLTTGLEYIQQNNVDIILLDLGLPDSQGINTLLKTQAQTPHTPIVLLTGYDDETFALNTVREGAQDYLVKDKLDSQLLVRALGYALERKRSEKELLQRNRELHLLNRIIAVSTTDFSIESILKVACQELVTAFDLCCVTVGLLNKNQTEITIAAETISEEISSRLNQTFIVANIPAYQNLCKAKKPLILDGTDPSVSSDLIDKLPYPNKVISCVMVPIVVKDEIVGIIELGSDKPRHFAEEEINLTWRVADQLAVVIAKIQLFEERQRLEELYHQAQRMEALGRLTGGVAHDFNNILTVINGFTELTLSQLPPDDPLSETLDTILRSGQHAADLVRQLLAFSRKQIIEPQMINVNDVVIEMQKMLRRVIGENIELETKLAPNLWPIKADPAQMEQVVMNLALNSRDAMPNGGKLIIETSNHHINGNHTSSYFKIDPGEYINLKVSDTGSGIDKEILKHIFEPFFTTKEEGKGSGLGLASVYGIIKQSDGDIICESTEGKGTTFSIYLPKASKKSATNIKKPELNDSIPTGTENILLVEDDVEIRKLIVNILKRQGYTLFEAQNGQQALSVFSKSKEPIHLLITDVIMPGMNGRAVAQSLKLAQPDLKVLFISGYMDDWDIDFTEVNLDFLQKPFNAAKLAYKVRDLLDR